MFSFIKKYAVGIAGIDIFPDIALAIFVTVFAAMLWIALRADKKYIQELEKIPFDN
jgi:uncharacterized membrane protein